MTHPIRVVRVIEYVGPAALIHAMLNSSHAFLMHEGHVRAISGVTITETVRIEQEQPEPPVEQKPDAR